MADAKAYARKFLVVSLSDKSSEDKKADEDKNEIDPVSCISQRDSSFYPRPRSDREVVIENTCICKMSIKTARYMLFFYLKCCKLDDFLRKRCHFRILNDQMTLHWFT